jgi:hypothetical protein
MALPMVQPEKMNLKLEIYNFWTPSIKFEYDRNIMEVALKDKVIMSSRWKMLTHINQCRLFLKAFNLSDLTKDGRKLHRPYLEGSERGKNDNIKILNIRRPTDNQWRVWKNFIYRNFLSPGININPPLGQALEVDECTMNLPTSEIDQYISKNLGPDNSVEELSQHLHPTLKCLLLQSIS